MEQKEITKTRLIIYVLSHQHINNQPRFCYFFLFHFQTPPIKS